jgi:hypothetical protein
MRILEVTPLMVMPPSSAKAVLVLSLIGSEHSLVEIGESTIFPHTLKCVLLIRQGRNQVHELCQLENTNKTKIVFILL